MAKINNGVWQVFGESIKLYFLNFDKFLLYLAFPVLGQIFGLLLIMFMSSLYVTYLPGLVQKNNIFNNFSTIFLLFLLIILPGFFIFVKAIIDYLIAYGALNSMAENAEKSNRVYDFTAHTELINRRSVGFFTLWLLFGIFSIVGLFPLFLVPAGILFIYFILIFQVFTFEPDKSPIGCFKKSFNIIKGNFARTCLLLALVGGITYFAVPEIIKYLFGMGHISNFLAIPFEGCVKQLPLNDINMILSKFPHVAPLTSVSVSIAFVNSIVAYFIICFTLPLRSICWTLWYKGLNKAESKIDNRIIERATSSSKRRKKQEPPSFEIE